LAFNTIKDAFILTFEVIKHTFEVVNHTSIIVLAFKEIAFRVRGLNINIINTFMVIRHVIVNFIVNIINSFTFFINIHSNYPCFFIIYYKNLFILNI
jgi:hypothetical protein